MGSPKVTVVPPLVPLSDPRLMRHCSTTTSGEAAVVVSENAR